MLQAVEDSLHGSFPIEGTGQQETITSHACVLTGEGQRLMDTIRDLIDAEPAAQLLHWDPQLLEGMS